MGGYWGYPSRADLGGSNPSVSCCANCYGCCMPARGVIARLRYG